MVGEEEGGNDVNAFVATSVGKLRETNQWAPTR